MVRCLFSLARILRVTDAASVVYRAQKADCRRFPTPATRHLAGGASRNFQVFSALDFLAEVTQDIPDKGCCERSPRPGVHPTQRTRIKTRLSRLSCSWSSI